MNIRCEANEVELLNEKENTSFLAIYILGLSSKKQVQDFSLCDSRLRMNLDI